LARAREHGYLDARRAGTRQLLRPYALWCWRLKLPVVWLERRTPRSRYARVHLDMFTTADRLTARGQSELAALGDWQLTVSPHDASWDRVPLKEAAALAHAVLRAATGPGNRELNRAKRPAKLFRMGPPSALPSAATAS
jgi:hypothetical protein